MKGLTLKPDTAPGILMEATWDKNGDIDRASFLAEVVANPASFGLSNVTERCYTGDDITFNGSGDVCPTPSSYLFWDGIHPTATGHALLAQAMLQIGRASCRERVSSPV